MRQRNRAGLPAVLYMHPREFVPDHPRLKLPAKRHFQCYYGVSSFPRKLDALLSEFAFGTLSSLLPESVEADSAAARDFAF